MTENAGSRGLTNNATDYNSSLSEVKYRNNFVYTNFRRFVVVRRKREFCYAWYVCVSRIPLLRLSHVSPIYTYSGRGTTKRGVRAAEHSIAYSWGQSPLMLPGEGGIHKPAIPIVMVRGEPSLPNASRIYFGIHHPIQYNVKVKEIGYVPEEHVPNLIGAWKEEDRSETTQDFTVTAHAEVPEENDGSEAEEQSEEEHEETEADAEGSGTDKDVEMEEDADEVAEEADYPVIYPTMSRIQGVLDSSECPSSPCGA
jgi:hypothetical protein